MKNRHTIRVSGKHRTRRLYPSEHTEPTDPNLIVDPWDEIDAGLDLERLLSTLSPGEADLVRKHHVEGFSQVELAADLGVDQATISRRISAAVKKMQGVCIDDPVSPALSRGVIHADPSRVKNNGRELSAPAIPSTPNREVC